MNLPIPNILGALCLMLSIQVAAASEYSHPTIERLLQAEDPPAGLVIELLAWDDATWSWAAPMIAALREQLHSKFPGADVAVVSHGGEQFQLTYDRIDEQPQALEQLTALSDNGVDIHVCGTHSQWKDVPETAYIDIVDVAPSGPARINDYIALGYSHILLKGPPD